MCSVPRWGLCRAQPPLMGLPPPVSWGLSWAVRKSLVYAWGWLCPWEESCRREEGVVWPWPWPWFPWRDVRGFELQISVNVDYGIWLRFSLPFPSSPAPCWASGPAGGWTSAACHLILRQVSAHPTAQGLSPWQEPPTWKGVRRKGGAQPGPREAGGIPGFSHAASHTPREQVDGPSSQVTSFCPCLCRCLCCLGFGFPI